MSRSVFNHRRLQPFLSTDQFNRADSNSLGNTDGFGNLDPGTWVRLFAYDTLVDSGLGIVLGSRVGDYDSDGGTPHGYHVNVIDLSTADVSLVVDANVENSAGRSAGIAFRAVDENNFWYAGLSATGTQVDLYKTVSGTESLVASSSSVGTLIGPLGVETTGSTIRTLFAGVVLTTTTDAFNSTATKHGIAMRNASSGSGGNQSRLEDWTADVNP